MIKIKLSFILFFFLIVLNFEAKSLEIKLLAKLNNYSITNIDLYNEINFIKSVEKKEVARNQYQSLLSEIINEKIREIETKEILLNNQDKNKITKQLESIMNEISRNDKSFNPASIKKEIYKKLEVKYKWEKMVFTKFKNKIEINLNEINLLINNYKEQKISKESLIEIERKKKLQLVSKSYFAQIKNKYLIKIY